ncbi:MAG TPA: TSUP family transporter [Candidatus Gallimonas gallistercoris]|uniref:Probable membrane transporter protein n=1 Tax=Candidatus Gallimonas gallistercoris TaxID=2838602 RepID=A0A9D2KEZ9_9FIRM|nr:TSUP family transporter [Candidatus Gallimonas gallistercoris]
MSFYLFFLCGVLGGVLGGMGMGGGTALIPLLTLFLGVPQAAAHGVNLLSFFPMAALALSVHAKNGLLKKEGLPFLVLPALVLSAAAALLAAHLPALLLRRAFGSFLVALSLFRLASAKKSAGGGEKRQKTW